MKHLLITIAAVAAFGQAAIIESRSDWPIQSTSTVTCVEINGSNVKPIPCGTVAISSPKFKANELKIGEMLPVKLSAEDVAALEQIESEIAKANAALATKKREIEQKHGISRDDRFGLTSITLGCNAPTWLEAEWRGEWLLITRKAGSSPCITSGPGGTGITFTPANKEQE
jgi:hypothetical protein